IKAVEPEITHVTADISPRGIALTGELDELGTEVEAIDSEHLQKRAILLAGAAGDVEHCVQIGIDVADDAGNAMGLALAILGGVGKVILVCSDSKHWIGQRKRPEK
ncbi:uncharacterized protein METZ01_LOCUS455680, partial [marine metagenome]